MAMAVAVACSIGAAHAQTQAQTPGARAPGSQARDRSVARACRTEIPRFCPALTEAAVPSGRRAAICLKPYKSSLSFGCRRAVRAIFP